MRPSLFKTHLNPHFLLEFNHLLPPSLLLDQLFLNCRTTNTDSQFHFITRHGADLFALKGGVHQLWFHTNSQAPCVSTSLAIGPCDAVDL